MALQTIRGGGRGSQTLVIKSDLKALEKELRTFGRSKVDKANVRAMNSAIRRAKTEAKRSISRQRYLKQDQVEKGLSLQFATPTRQEVAIKGRGRMLALTALKDGVTGPRQFPLGVKATTQVGGGKKLIPRAFLARMRSGHVGVFQRSDLGGGPKRVRRLPIQELLVPSIPHTLTNDKTIKDVTTRYGEIYSKTLAKQYAAAVRRANDRIRT